MRGNSFGKLFSLTSFGESHGPAMGVVIDGVPAGLDVDEQELQSFLDRRSPGRLAGTTTRKEADRAEILSGTFEGKTLGTPISIIVRNTNQRSEDYKKLKNNPRPGHADNTTILKYGIRDHRGGGRSSGRETLSRVAAGYFASLVLPKLEINSFALNIGEITWEESLPVSSNSKYYYPNEKRDDEIRDYLSSLQKEGESVGGRVYIRIENCPVGLGEPAFDKLKADLAKAIMSIGAVTGFSYGIGEKFATLKGSEIADTTPFGGIEGGISNGDPIILNVVIKPTSTVGEKAKEGRHDPCIIPRAIPVIESMIRITLADHYLRQNAYEINNGKN